VCEEEPAIRDVYQELLASEGYRVTVLSAPCDDLTEVVRLAPDLLILDLLFAKQPSGSAFLQHLKTHPATQALPVLVCTAADRLADQAQQRWDCAAVAKPFNLDELLLAVRNCLRANAGTA
jgi:DNA-binding response OmpR family regulator